LHVDFSLGETEEKEIYMYRREEDKRNKHEYMSAVGTQIQTSLDLSCEDAKSTCNVLTPLV
jgi:hypothetical protein